MGDHVYLGNGSGRCAVCDYPPAEHDEHEERIAGRAQLDRIEGKLDAVVEMSARMVATLERYRPLLERAETRLSRPAKWGRRGSDDAT